MSSTSKENVERTVGVLDVDYWREKLLRYPFLLVPCIGVVVVCCVCTAGAGQRATPWWGAVHGYRAEMGGSLEGLPPIGFRDYPQK